MPRSRTDRLQSIVRALTRQIVVLKRLCPPETVEMVRIARLAVQMQLHGISEEELGALCDWLRQDESTWRLQ
jgi:hypothetical protein